MVVQQTTQERSRLATGMITLPSVATLRTQTTAIFRRPLWKTQIIDRAERSRKQREGDRAERARADIAARGRPPMEHIHHVALDSLDPDIFADNKEFGKPANEMSEKRAGWISGSRPHPS